MRRGGGGLLGYFAPAAHKITAHPLPHRAPQAVRRTDGRKSEDGGGDPAEDEGGDEGEEGGGGVQRVVPRGRQNQR